MEMVLTRLMDEAKGLVGAEVASAAWAELLWACCYLGFGPCVECFVLMCVRSQGLVEGIFFRPRKKASSTCCKPPHTQQTLKEDTKCTYAVNSAWTWHLRSSWLTGSTRSCTLLLLGGKSSQKSRQMVYQKWPRIFATVLDLDRLLLGLLASRLMGPIRTQQNHASTCSLNYRVVRVI